MASAETRPYPENTRLILQLYQRDECDVLRDCECWAWVSRSQRIANVSEAVANPTESGNANCKDIGVQNQEQTPRWTEAVGANCAATEVLRASVPTRTWEIPVPSLESRSTGIQALENSEYGIDL
ncbi:hypothetical protein CI238_09057 [Colletotrichum incanum]|uniref:Uncharacterized protein n=1 Tax=Colletotrichum incanum TaxID=1573173 RepID=A0A161W114_COLIC|nr:hypothetical protein CI238_09057 [Colletotrichum incanum]